MAKYTINLQDIQSGMTMGEVRTLARVSGMSMEEAQALETGNLSRLPFSAMIGIIYILMRRQNPRLTEADLDGLNMDEITFVAPDTIGDDGTADPPQPLQPLKPGGQKSSARSVATTV